MDSFISILSSLSINCSVIFFVSLWEILVFSRMCTCICMLVGGCVSIRDVYIQWRQDNIWDRSTEVTWKNHRWEHREKSLTGCKRWVLYCTLSNKVHLQPPRQQMHYLESCKHTDFSSMTTFEDKIAEKSFFPNLKCLKLHLLIYSYGQFWSLEKELAISNNISYCRLQMIL